MAGPSAGQLLVQDKLKTKPILSDTLLQGVALQALQAESNFTGRTSRMSSESFGLLCWQASLPTVYAAKISPVCWSGSEAEVQNPAERDALRGAGEGLLVAVQNSTMLCLHRAEETLVRTSP